MKIFLSWSGDKSHQVARVFNDWLPSIVQALEPWLSSEHIQKGAAWLEEIKNAVNESNGVGLFFLTAEALSSSWVLFEAGGVAALEQKRVCTILVDVEPSAVKPPLSFFQATKLERADLFRLLQDINKRLKSPLDDVRLQRSFDRAWPEFETHLRQALKTPETKSSSTAGKSGPVGQVESSVLSTAKAVQGIEARLGRLEQESQKQNSQVIQGLATLQYQVQQLSYRPVYPPTDFNVVSSSPGLPLTIGSPAKVLGTGLDVSGLNVPSVPGANLGFGDANTAFAIGASPIQSGSLIRTSAEPPPKKRPTK